MTENFKLVPIDSELNSAPGNQTHFWKKVGVPRKAAKVEKVVEKKNPKKKTTFGTKRLKTGIWWDQTLCIFWMPGIVLVTWAGFHFHSDPLMLDHTIYFTKKCSKSAKGNPIFHLKGRRATRLGLTDLDSPNFCLEFFYFPWFRPSNFGYLPFREKFAFFQRFIKRCFCIL